MAASQAALAKARSCYDTEEFLEAVEYANDALNHYKTSGDAKGKYDSQRLSLVSQVASCSLKPEKALQTAKVELVEAKKEGKIAEGFMQMAIAELHYYNAEFDKAIKAATDAQGCFEKSDAQAEESEVLCKVKTIALIEQGLASKAVTAANLGLSLAQRTSSSNSQGEAGAWLALTKARLADGSADAIEAATKTLGLFQKLGDVSMQSVVLKMLAEGQLVEGDLDQAMTYAKDALEKAKEGGSPELIAEASYTMVDVFVAMSNFSEAASIAASTLANLQRRNSMQGVATAMHAVAFAETAHMGSDAGLSKIKEFVLDRRAAGDKKGECYLMHKWATMTQYPDIAMNTAQAAKKLAEEIGHMLLELSIRKSITDLWVAKGKPEKAPTRKQALLGLKEMANYLKMKDGENFDEAYQKFLPFAPAVKQGDYDAILFPVLAEDEAEYTAFLEEHNFFPKKQTAASSQVSKFGGIPMKKACQVPMAWHYMLFRFGGLGYGPRYRCCMHPFKDLLDAGGAQSIVELQDVHDDWERELAYNPSMLDCGLQTGAAVAYVPEIHGRY
jgi:tetratricopeptide (TPR) repeat protein